jgi:glycosyltransferase involved in cell wall biosynthesis
LTQAGLDHSVSRLKIPADRISIIPRGRRHQDVVADAAGVQNLTTAAGNRPILLNVGRQESQKGQDLLVEVVRLLRDAGKPCLAWIAGREGAFTSTLQREIERADVGDSVRLLGARADVPQLLAACDIVCVTSRWEGLGGAIIEALGAGKPIVAFGIPVVEEVAGDAAALVEPFDAKGFAAAVSDLLADSDRRVELAERARARFGARFAMQPVTDAIGDMYCRVTAHPPS